MLTKHRKKLKEVKDGESVWLSFKAWVWAILIVYALLAIALSVGYLYAREKYI